jgi:hypothetical protein
MIVNNQDMVDKLNQFSERKLKLLKKLLSGFNVPYAKEGVL